MRDDNNIEQEVLARIVAAYQSIRGSGEVNIKREVQGKFTFTRIRCTREQVYRFRSGDDGTEPAAA